MPEPFEYRLIDEGLAAQASPQSSSQDFPLERNLQASQAAVSLHLKE